MNLKVFYCSMLCLPFFCLQEIITETTFHGEWNFVKEKSGIQVFTRFPENSDIKELKIVLEVESSLSSIVALIDDTERYSEWVYKSKGAKLVKRLGVNEVVYYNEIEFPWPLRNREILIHSTLHQDEVTKVITYESEVCSENLVEANEENVRLKEYYSQWVLEPISLDKVKITYRLKSDPGGNIPKWAINLGIDVGVIETMSNFKTLLKESTYEDAHVDHIID